MVIMMHKKSNQIEYIVKGFANKRRIEIIFLLDENPEMSVSEIADKLPCGFNSTSAHLLKMMATGIIMKRNDQSEVRHALTQRGKAILKQLKQL